MCLILLYTMQINKIDKGWSISDEKLCDNVCAQVLTNSFIADLIGCQSLIACCCMS